MKKLFAILFVLFAGTTLAEEQPNILWLTCEDNNINWVGCYGNPYAETPNIDRLAGEGMRMTSFYVTSSVCSPTPATNSGTGTGSPPNRTGLRGWRMVPATG